MRFAALFDARNHIAFQRAFSALSVTLWNFTNKLFFFQVHSTESRVRRVLSTGWLELICPRLHPLPKKKKANVKKIVKKPIVEKKGTLNMTQLSTDSSKSFLEELPMDFIDDPDVPPLV